MTSTFVNNPPTRARIRRLAGKVPSHEIARELGISPGTLRNIASRMQVSLRIGPERESERPAPDDHAVARLDATRARTIELDRVIISAEVAQKLTVAATERGLSLKGLVAQIVSFVALDGMVNAVMDDR